MQREEVEHVLRAAAAISKEYSFVIVGSQAVTLLLRNRLIDLETLLARITLLTLDQAAAQHIAAWATRRAAEAQASTGITPNPAP